MSAIRVAGKLVKWDGKWYVAEDEKGCRAGEVISISSVDYWFVQLVALRGGDVLAGSDISFSESVEIEGDIYVSSGFSTEYIFETINKIKVIGLSRTAWARQSDVESQVHVQENE
jgi:hypothetical protein